MERKIPEPANRTGPQKNCGLRGAIPARGAMGRCVSCNDSLARGHDGFGHSDAGPPEAQALVERMGRCEAEIAHDLNDPTAPCHECRLSSRD